MKKRRLLRTIAALAAAVIIAGVPAASAGGYTAGPAVSATDGFNPAASLPEKGTFGEKFGAVQSHLHLYDDETITAVLTQLKEARVGWIRTTFCWHHIEPVRDAPDYTRHDFVVNQAHALGIKVLGILGGTPKWASPAPVPDPAQMDPLTYYFIALPYYDNTYWAFPPKEDFMPAWRNHVFATVSRYEGKVDAWEIGNEENIDAFWRPAPDAAQYTAFVKETTPQIRAANPGAMVVMGGLAGLGPDFMNQSFENSIAAYAPGSDPAYAYIDAVAFHPYPEAILFNNYLPNEDYMRGWGVLGFVRDQISTHCPPQKTPQIWLTELGWSTTTPTIDEDTQAAYMMRTLINYATEKVDKVFYYNLWDESTGSGASLYGLLRNDFSKKPAWYYYRTFMDTFGRAVSPAPGTAAYTSANNLSAQLESHAFYLRDGKLAIGLWNRNNNADSVMVTLSETCWADPVTVDPLTGAAQSISGSYRDGQGRLVLPGIAVGKSPVILMLERPALISAVHGSSAVIDTVRGIICGIEPGSQPLEGSVEAAQGYSLVFTPSPVGFGTGTVVSVIKDGQTAARFTLVIYGDVNGDGNIDTNDAGAIVDTENFCLSWHPSDDAVYILAADVNGDGNIDSSDAGIVVDAENWLLTIDQTTGLAS